MIGLGPVWRWNHGNRTFADNLAVMARVASTASGIAVATRVMDLDDDAPALRTGSNIETHAKLGRRQPIDSSLPHIQMTMIDTRQED